MAAHPDVLVVGGGVIGLTSAYLLAQSGLRVEVVDKGEMGREASWAGAGILPPWGAGEYATPLDRLRAYSVSRFESFSAELRGLTGIDNEYHVCGGREYLGSDDADQPALWRREGIVHERIGRTGGADTYHLPYAQVRNPRHLKALAAGCQTLGVKLSPGRPFSGWNAAGGRLVLVTAGAWASQLLDAVTVRPVRGQMVLLRPDDFSVWGVHICGKRYLVPRRDGRVLVGSTEEPEAGFDKVTTPPAIAGLVEFAASLDPKLRGAEVEASWAGLRPGTADGLPYIGRVPGFANVVVAAGHFRAGIQTSLGTAECVRALVLGEPPPLPLGPFAVGRAPYPPMRSAFRS